MDKAQIIGTFIEENSATQPILKQAIKYCKKQQATLIVSRLDRLSLDIDKLYAIKKQLGDQLIACDLPQTDRLTISIHLGVLQRQKLLNSIRRKASIATKKAKGRVYGNPQNFTAVGRKLGLEKIKSNASSHPKKKKILAIIQKCQALNMSYGAIAEALNQNGFRTVRGKLFVRNTVRRVIKANHG